MEILELIKNRRSIRSFKSDPISEEVIDKLIEAIIWAPSAGNRQMRKFFFVFNNDLKKKIAMKIKSITTPKSVGSSYHIKSSP